MLLDAGVRNNLVCVQAFGDFSWTVVKRADVTDFETGVRLGFHQKKKQQAFQRGIFEVSAYLQVNSVLSNCPPFIIHHGSLDHHPMKTFTCC